jgi:hypothetical protein
MPLVLVSPELTALLRECPRGGRGLIEHALGFVRHGVVWLGPDDRYAGCSSVEVIWRFAGEGWPRWQPTVAQHAYDRTRARAVR